MYVVKPGHFPPHFDSSQCRLEERDLDLQESCAIKDAPALQSVLGLHQAQKALCIAPRMVMQMQANQPETQMTQATTKQ
jgi:hypothetical protein